MGHRTLGPKYLQQAICPGRVQLAVPGGRYLDRHRLRRPAISGRPPDLLAVPRRTQNLWRDAARQILIASIGICRATSRSEEHTSELQSLMRISYAVFCLKKKK